jgi:aryl-alcohol dehydrogenase-like predicted oxidoreductase
MRKRALGRTGRLVSELALGTWGLAGEAYGRILDEEAERVIRRALDIGITLFDTADSYGGGKVEALLGRVLEKRADVVIVTKGGTDRTTDPARKRFDAEYLKAAVDRSRKRLRRDKLDLYLLHNPSYDALSVGEGIDCLRELVRAGKIARFGVSCGDAEVARAALDRGAEVISLAYNLLHASDLHHITGDVMVTGAGVLVHSVLAYGILGGGWAKQRDFPDGDHRRDRWTKMEFERRIEQTEGLRFLVQGNVPSLRGAAVRFALTNHVVSSAILGPKSVAQLEQLVRDTGGGPVYLPDDAMRTLPRELQKLGLML